MYLWERYFRLDPNKVCAFWIALDPATVENGCMHLVPNTHKSGIVTHRVPQNILNDDSIASDQKHIFYSLPTPNEG